MDDGVGTQFQEWSANPSLASEKTSAVGQPYMSPYAAGVGLGLVLLLTFFVMGRGLGASGAINSFVAVGINSIAPGHVEQNEFFSAFVGDFGRPPLAKWIVFELAGVILGGYLSAGRVRKRIDRGPRVSATSRMGYAFVGGTTMGVGMVLARGCTSGQGLTGGAMLNVGSWGFLLERAGLGNGRKLAAQFYLTDLAVFKVMFTAILTAMVGLFVLSRVGLLDLSRIYMTPTYLVPQIVGGLVFGVGFVTGGYCPGTSCVAASSGRIDAGVLLVGMMFGVLLVGESYEWIRGFHEMTSMGRATLDEVLHV